MSLESPYPTDWPKRRANVLNRDNHECQGCGISNDRSEELFGVGLHAHHIDPISDGGSHELGNLIALCQECHVQTHRKNSEEPYEPLYWNECIVCGREFSSLESEDRHYCSKYCVAKKTANSLENVVMNDQSVCSTCFAKWPSGHECCPNCDNWHPNERHPEILEGGDVDWEHLLVRIGAWYEFYE